MSSPIAKHEKSALDRSVIAAHQRLSHTHRIRLLAENIVETLQTLVDSSLERKLRVLDVGCGDMSLADSILERMSEVEITCTDIHPCPAALRAADPRWQRYIQFDGTRLPFQAGAFDVVMFSDVLHHVPSELRVALLESAGVVGHRVLVKDHLEYGWWSRQALRAMDWIGNFSYGISIPVKYFDRESFARLCQAAQMRTTSLRVGLSLYEHLPLVRTLTSKDWHFIAVCERQE